MDSPAANAAFAKQIGISFPLLSDMNKKMLTAYGVLKVMTSRTRPTSGLSAPTSSLTRTASFSTSKKATAPSIQTPPCPFVLPCTTSRPRTQPSSRAEPRALSLVGDGEFDDDRGGYARSRLRCLVNDGAARPLRRVDVVDLAPQPSNVQPVLRLGFVQAD